MLKSRKKSAENKKGIFIISLDFELMWGVHDVFKDGEYRENILGVHQVIPALLQLFNTYHIHATWAIVGMLYFKNYQDLKENIPKTKPTYMKKHLSPYPYLANNRLSMADHLLHFAPNLIEQIRSTPKQEIAAHTFSHYYCLEKGQTKEQFIADMEQYKKINQQRGIHVKSIVFPRNQINPTYVKACKQLGFSAYRGNEKSWIYRLQRNDRQQLLKRGLRLIDTYFNLFGHQTYPIQQIDREFPVNLPSSRFLRPVLPTFKWLERKKVTRILNDMTYAAKQGEIYHLWWHPHNFGVNRERNLAMLKKILTHYKQLQSTYGFKSRSMSEVTAELMQSHTEHIRVTY